MRSTIDLCMLDIQFLWLETFGISIALSILKKIKDKVAALKWPAALRPLDLFALIAIDKLHGKIIIITLGTGAL